MLAACVIGLTFAGPPGRDASANITHAKELRQNRDTCHISGVKPRNITLNQIGISFLHWNCDATCAGRAAAPAACQVASRRRRGALHQLHRRQRTTLDRAETSKGHIVAMFVDLRGSTRLAGQHLPFDTVFDLSSFLTAMGNAVLADGRTDQSDARRSVAWPVRLACAPDIAACQAPHAAAAASCAMSRR